MSNDPPLVTAADLRHLMAEREEQRHRERLEAEAKARAQHDMMVERFRASHLTEDEKRSLIRHFQSAALRGEKEIQVCRFPSDVCTDGGRAINNGDPDWPDTLEGKPRDIYELWHEHLRPWATGCGRALLIFPVAYPAMRRCSSTGACRVSPRVTRAARQACAVED